MIKKLFAAALALLALAGLQIRAEGNDCSSWSSEDAFTYSSITVAKAFFYKELNDRRSQAKAYLVKNDVVAVRNVKSDWTCALYVGATGSQTIGWLESKALKTSKVAQNIVGNWTTDSGDANLSISQSGSTYRIKGNAIFRTSDNTGEVSGNLKLTRGQWIHEDNSCKLNILFLNNQLLVQDNLGCGGLNVTFSGAYQRKK